MPIRLLGLDSQGEAHGLQQVKDGDAEIALHEVGRRRLLEVQVEVTERARGYESVGAGVDRVGQVTPGLAQ